MKTFDVLPMPEIHDIMKDRLAAASCIVAARIMGKNLVCFNGNFRRFSVPLEEFTVTARGVTPDFNDLHIDDWGNTVRLGKYEIASDYIIGVSL